MVVTSSKAQLTEQPSSARPPLPPARARPVAGSRVPPPEVQRGQPACQGISAGQRSAELWEGPKTQQGSAKSPICDTGNPVPGRPPPGGSEDDDTCIRCRRNANRYRRCSRRAFPDIAASL